MKETLVYGVLVLFLMSLAGIPALFAEEEDIITQEGAAGAAGDDSRGNSAAPVRMIEELAGENDFDPSAFEGDSESMSGERAPENMPMDDAPVEGGIAI